MTKRGRKFLYLSNLDFDGTVFRTQVLDWLDLYEKNNLFFDLVQLFHIKDLKRPGSLKKQLKGLKKSTKLYAGFLFLFPSKSLFYFVNALIIFCKISKYFIKYQEILIFSRAIIGKEITFIRKISPVKILFYFDARAAAAEENKYLSIKEHDFSLGRYIMLANIYYLVYNTLCAADKVFIVSNVLKKYFQDMYNLYDKEFVLYPCLSDSNKFYFDLNIRNELRQKLQIPEQTRVYIYSGGIDSAWHITERMFAFLNELFKHEKNSMLICLIINPTGLDMMLNEFPELKSRFLSFSVPNNEVFKFLNASDYGILFRENTIMNNVASPTKFAEYILCGLPVLITEGIGDYSEYAITHNLGVLIREDVLKYPERFDNKRFVEKSFDRNYISGIGTKSFCKESIINKIITEFKS